MRDMNEDDAQTFYKTYRSYGWHPSLDTYLKYYQEQADGKRKVFIAVYEGKTAGICTLVLHPDEGNFADLGIPEIVDLGVFFHLHKHGKMQSKTVRFCHLVLRTSVVLFC